MGYTTYDFQETLNRVGPPVEHITRVLAAWGEDGDCAEWEGGFMLALDDGKIAYVTGWCDTTGWGCQDGGQIHHYDERPVMVPSPYYGDAERQPDWDEEPIDLNLWLTTAQSRNKAQTPEEKA